MAFGLIDKLTNFLMPIEDETEIEDSKPVSTVKTSRLRLHTTPQPGEMKIVVAVPTAYEDVRIYAEHLKANVSVIVNFQRLDETTRRCVGDFLNGVCYVIAGSVQRISESILIYVPGFVEVKKELYSYSIPTYVKEKGEI